MIEYDNPNFNANLSALVQGMWYSELPELIDLDRIYNNFESVLRSMESGKYPYYPLDDSAPVSVSVWDDSSDLMSDAISYCAFHLHLQSANIQ